MDKEWTTETPTESGFYWCFITTTRSACIVHLKEVKGGASDGDLIVFNHSGTALSLASFAYSHNPNRVLYWLEIDPPHLPEGY